MSNSAFPIVNVPDSSGSSIVPDTSASAFTKYNFHEHNRSLPPDFRHTPISIYDDIYIYDSLGNDVFPTTTPAKIDYITGETIRVTLSASKSLSQATMYVKYPIGNSSAIIIKGIEVTDSSNLLTFSTPSQPNDFQQKEGKGIPGFISQTQLSSLLKADQTLFLSYNTWPTEQVIIPKISTNCWLVALHQYSVGFSVTAQVKYYDPNGTSTFNDISTWINYGAAFAFSSSTQNSNIFIPFSEAGSWGTYPTSRPTSYIPKDSSIALTFATAPSANSTLALTLELLKIV